MAVKVRSGGSWVDVATAGGGGISTVRQYSDNESPRTERTCTNPITTSGSTIGIGTTSNAYGSKYVQDTEPTTSCDGDIWFDTTLGDGGGGMSYSTKTGTYTLVAGDDQRLIATNSQINVNQDIFSPSDAITIYNNSASGITIAQGTGVTLRLAGTSTTGNRTVAARGIATIVCVVNNEFVAIGGGLS